MTNRHKSMPFCQKLIIGTLLDNKNIGTKIAAPTMEQQKNMFLCSCYQKIKKGAKYDIRQVYNQSTGGCSGGS
jgi:hypothetical protein